jgi:hypothetical protein
MARLAVTISMLPPPAAPTWPHFTPHRVVRRYSDYAWLNAVDKTSAAHSVTRTLGSHETGGRRMSARPWLFLQGFFVAAVLQQLLSHY